MKIFYQVVLHATNLFFLFVVGVVFVAASSNISAGDIPALDIVTVGLIIFLLLLTLGNYAFQVIKGGWKVLLIGHTIYIAVFLLSLFLFFPLLYAKVHYS